MTGTPQGGIVSPLLANIALSALDRRYQADWQEMRAFEVLEPLLLGRSFVLGGDLNLSRNYDTAYRTSHHTEFLDGLTTRGFFDCMRKFHPEEQRTFWGRTTRDYQNDHLFVSEDLAARVAGCDVVDRAQLSDHSPLRLILGSTAEAVS